LAECYLETVLLNSSRPSRHYNPTLRSLIWTVFTQNFSQKKYRKSKLLRNTSIWTSNRLKFTRKYAKGRMKKSVQRLLTVNLQVPRLNMISCSDTSKHKISYKPQRWMSPIDLLLIMITKMDATIWLIYFWTQQLQISLLPNTLWSRKDKLLSIVCCYFCR
jgi:hypothetical protein